MIEQYLPLIIMLIFGFAVALLFMFFSEWLGARRGTAEKKTTYESGMIPYKTARDRFSVKFYMVAVSFIIFDIEVVFLYPWAITFKSMGAATLVSLVSMVIFILILVVGYIYEIKKGGLDWN